MKKLALSVTLIFASVYMASAQLLPSFQFGLKGGMNLARLPSTEAFAGSNQAGYLGGIWMRFGALGFNFQPEMYITQKNVDITTFLVTGNAGGSTANDTKAKFTSIDVPLLFGTKIGAFGVGGRLYTGPVVSFAINKDQSFSGVGGDVLHLNYKNQNYAWQFGAGLDIKKISVDLRYEAGLSSQTYVGGSTHINLFNLSLGYRLF